MLRRVRFGDTRVTRSEHLPHTYVGMTTSPLVLSWLALEDFFLVASDLLRRCSVLFDLVQLSKGPIGIPARRKSLLDNSFLFALSLFSVMMNCHIEF